jgi:hypothetical protein
MTSAAWTAGLAILTTTVASAPAGAAVVVAEAYDTSGAASDRVAAIGTTRAATAATTVAPR